MENQALSRYNGIPVIESHIIPAQDTLLVNQQTRDDNYFDANEVGHSRRAAFAHLCNVMDSVSNNVRNCDMITRELFLVFYYANKLLDVNAAPYIGVESSYNTSKEVKMAIIIFTGTHTTYRCSYTKDAENTGREKADVIADYVENLAYTVDDAMFRVVSMSHWIDELHKMRRFIHINQYTGRVMKLVDTVLEFRAKAPVMQAVIEKFMYPINRKKYYIGAMARPLILWMISAVESVDRKRDIKRKCVEKWLATKSMKTIMKKDVVKQFKRRIAIKHCIVSARKHIAEKPECSVCLSEMTTQDTLTVTTCKHTYHKECFKHYLTSKGEGGVSVPCAICRFYLIVSENCTNLYPHEFIEKQ